MPAPGRVSAPAQLVELTALMAMTGGSPDVRVGLIDGPVTAGHPDLARAAIVAVGDQPASCDVPDSAACGHGTFVAGILVGRRDSSAPSLCPECTLLVRPIFSEQQDVDGGPLAAPTEVGKAIVDCVDAGATVINLSAAVGHPTVRVEMTIRDALDYASARGALVVAAAGNQSTLGSSEITRHPGVIPVVAYDLHGRLLDTSNIGLTVGRRGLGGPGEAISLGIGRSSRRLGTSVATAFVTGAAALLLSLFADASASAVQRALLRGAPRRSVVPPLLNARTAYYSLAAEYPVAASGAGGASGPGRTGSRRWGAARR